MPNQIDRTGGGKGCFVVILTVLLTATIHSMAYAQCGNRPIVAPSLVNPANNAVYVSLTPTLELTINTPLPRVGSCDHLGTQWQITTDAEFAFNRIVFDSGLTEEHKTSIAVPDDALATNTKYYWRTRITALEGDLGPPRRAEVIFSSWSASRAFTTLSCNWAGSPINPGQIRNTTPEDGTLFVSLAPTLKWERTPLAEDPVCNPDLAQWQIATDPAFGPDDKVYDSGPDAVNVNSLIVPAGILQGSTAYYWRVRLQADTGEIRDWTTATRFSTAIIAFVLCNWTTIFNVAPADGAFPVSLMSTLELDFGVGLSPICPHDVTQWQIATDSGFGPDDIVYNPGNDAVNLTSLDVPEGILENGNTYYWRARLKSTGGAVSGWTRATSFSTAIVLVVVLPCNFPSINKSNPADGALDVLLTPTLKVSIGGGVIPVCSHDITQWQIALKAAFDPAFMVFNSGDDVANLLTLNVPDGILFGATTYHWRARFKSNNGRLSDWTEVTSFKTLGEEPGEPVDQQPNANFSFDPPNPEEGQNVQFTDRSTAPASDIIAWSWNFGDGTTSAVQHPSHTFDREGIFTVTLTITNDSGTQSSISKDIDVGRGPVGLTTVCALDVNRNDVLDDNEILKAIRLWISNEEVSDTGRSITDEAILDLLAVWITGAPLSCA